ncbi:MAG: YitT family protein [Ruminococcaceae bacterium]|nr:YitT family protein [Oscillospiraceae bacterium]
MRKQEVIKRYILFIISLFFSGLGIACTKASALGVSTISSIANVLNIRFDFISMGLWLIITNMVLFVGEIIVLRRNFKPIQCLQIPLVFLFGYFTDLGGLIIRNISLQTYFTKLLMCVSGVIILGFGVALAVIANAILNPGEAFVKAIADTLNKNFGNVKIVFDICCVVTAVSLSLIFFNGKISGVREGTLIAAILTGLSVKFFVKILNKPIQKILE